MMLNFLQIKHFKTRYLIILYLFFLRFFFFFFFLILPHRIAADKYPEVNLFFNKKVVDADLDNGKLKILE